MQMNSQKIFCERAKIIHHHYYYYYYYYFFFFENECESSSFSYSFHHHTISPSLDSIYMHKSLYITFKSSLAHDPYTIPSRMLIQNLFPSKNNYGFYILSLLLSVTTHPIQFPSSPLPSSYIAAIYIYKRREWVDV
jgi:hypothetical protein